MKIIYVMIYQRNLVKNKRGVLLEDERLFLNAFL